MKTFDEHIETRVVDNIKVEIYGCGDCETAHNEYDFYDLYVDGECINLGEPLFDKPTDEVIRLFLE